LVRYKQLRLLRLMVSFKEDLDYGGKELS
jgi:hypothetical protein